MLFLIVLREKNDKKVTWGRREKLGLLCYKLPAICTEKYSICEKYQRMLEWVAAPFSKGSSQSRDQNEFP